MEKKLYLLRHKVNGKFLHRKYKSAHQRQMAPYYDRNKGKSKMEMFFISDSPIDAALFPTIAGIKTSFYGWGKWEKIPNPNKMGPYYKKVPGTEWFDEMDVYVLHPCIAGQIKMEKMEHENI